LPEDLALGRRYVEDARFRRQVLEQSLVNPENGYSRLRLERYREEDWGALPEWNPPVAAVNPAGTEEYRALSVDSVPWEREALLALGREAFFRYPVQMQEALRLGLKHPEIYGLWRTPDSLGGAVREQVAVGPPRLAVTCATCHAMAGRDGALVAGLPNAKLDLGAMLADTFPSKKALPSWGPGRVDLSSDGLDNPVAISDLRAVRSEHYLHHDATVRNGLIELAIRIETLIITSNHWTLRPPRKLVFALALYLWEMQPRAAGQRDEASGRGEIVFRSSCAGCHKPPDYSGDRIALTKVGTDPIVGISSDRTTGTYRVPTLRGVGDRSPLLASGQVPGIDALLDPARAARGHRYGMELSPGDRSDLLAFLRTLQ
jgi:mono/diheme cytochrome c family protein